jgi:hypothetical protein
MSSNIFGGPGPSSAASSSATSHQHPAVSPRQKPSRHVASRPTSSTAGSNNPFASGPSGSNSNANANAKAKASANSDSNIFHSQSQQSRARSRGRAQRPARPTKNGGNNPFAKSTSAHSGAAGMQNASSSPHMTPSHSQSHMVDHSNEINQLRGDNAQLRNRVDALEGTISAMQEQQADLRKLLDDVMSQLHEVRQSADAARDLAHQAAADAKTASSSSSSSRGTASSSSSSGGNRRFSPSPRKVPDKPRRRNSPPPPDPYNDFDEQPLGGSGASYSQSPPADNFPEHVNELDELPVGSGATELPPEHADVGNLESCRHCGRNFNPAALKSHIKSKICFKKRKKFDMSKQRVDPEAKVVPKSKAPRKKKGPPKWKQQRAALREAMQAGKMLAQAVCL